jgi:hypothetical protein
MKQRLWAAMAMSMVFLTGCKFLAVATAPEKKASSTRSQEALKADALFWDTFHNGRYDQIPQALNAETAAYLDNPSDAVTAAHVAWLHSWRVSERARLDDVPATITDDIVLAHQYFQEAVKLNPHDPRTLGFLAGHMLADGNINQDEKLTRRGYYTLLDSIKAWPEFNLFTAGYVMSRQPANSDLFHKALAWQWETLDRCFEEKVDRRNIDYAKYMKLATTEGNKRVCWNSWIAPHNFEGFFLNMGDMLVKSGDWQTAQKIYAQAKLSPTYDQWKYKDVLEQRTTDAQANVAYFNSDDPKLDKLRQRMMIATPIACMACHENGR